MAVCPFADQSKRYDRKYPGSYVAGFPWRLVPHSTETTGLPSYSGGSVAPHFTVDPRRRRIWQHFDTARPSRALEHRPGTIDTNNARAVQVEIVAYSDATACKKAKGLYVGSLTAAEQAVVRQLFVWIMRTHGISATTCPTKAYPASYGDHNGVRLSDAAWRAFRGVAEHQNVPHNNHGDAGSLALRPLILAPQPIPAPVPVALREDEMRTRMVYEEGAPAPVPIYATDCQSRRWLQNQGDKLQLIASMKQDGYPLWYQVPHAIPAGTLERWGPLDGPDYVPPVPTPEG